ncbi:alpha/beta hydrolase [Propylenella binzhouense]|uniref:alpha/beta hydrolase n=1 Tax=Propylenella binzhouense TaxID=2555902 RepID=UPI0019677E60|nr:alpha/beta fold hydrolase [Propylenella binzhouense]
MRSRRILRVAAWLAALAAFAYLAAGSYLYAVQRSYVFVPGGTLGTPESNGLAGVEVVTLDRGGVVLTGWHAPARDGMPTLLYFHGNAGNLSGRADRFRQVLDSGFGLAAFSYRGYPGSGGAPSEEALFSDALAEFDWLAERTGRIVLHGESLGTGIATYVASRRDAGALVLEAPYTAALDIAGATYPWLPVSVLMRDPFVTREHISRVAEPILIFHGTADRVIPIEHGRALARIAGDRAELVVVEGAGHSELWKRGLWQRALAFFAAKGLLP